MDSQVSFDLADVKAGDRVLSAWQALVDTVAGGEYGERSLQVLRPGGLPVMAVDRTNAALAAKAEAAGRRFAGIAVDRMLVIGGQ